jgi:hypothetical protein
MPRVELLLDRVSRDAGQFNDFNRRAAWESFDDLDSLLIHPEACVVLALHG